VLDIFYPSIDLNRTIQLPRDLRHPFAKPVAEWLDRRFTLVVS
jgi:hypothetical protein